MSTTSDSRGIARRSGHVASWPARHIGQHVGLGIVLLALPLVIPASDLQIVNLAFIYGIAAIGLNIVFGLSGLLSIAQGAIMGIGAYSFVFASNATVGLFPSVLLSCLASGAASGLTGLASARIKSHYFVLLTLALAEAFNLLVINNADITGGSNGVALGINAHIGHLQLGTANGLYVVVLPLLLISWYLADCFKRSRQGLALRALNTDEYLALMAGIATARARFIATAIGGVFAGLAGALLAVDDAYIGPQSFDLDTSSLLLLIIVLGGPGSNAGTVVAAVILTLLLQGMLMFTTVGQLIYGLAIIVLIIIAPDGISGLTERFVWHAPQVRGLVSRMAWRRAP